MCACITLQQMGKRDDSSPRRTREFDTARLAALTKQPLPDKPAPHKAEPDNGEAEAGAAPQPSALAVGRAQTIDDPLTTGLLAEVARRSQTVEFDEDVIHEVLERAGSPVGPHAEPHTGHPHTRRRTAK